MVAPKRDAPLPPFIPFFVPKSSPHRTQLDAFSRQLPKTSSCDSSLKMSDEEPLVLQDLRRFLAYRSGSDELESSVDDSEKSSLFDKSAMAVPVAAMKAMLCVVERTEAETMMQLQDELREASDIMLMSFSRSGSGRSHIALKSGTHPLHF